MLFNRAVDVAGERILRGGEGGEAGQDEKQGSGWQVHLESPFDATLGLQVHLRSRVFFAMTIGELARRTGLSPSAIRYYEQERLIPQARRVSGRREFEEGVLAQLVVVQLARNAGFTIAEVRRLGGRQVPYEILGINTPRDLAFKVMAR